jgi:septum formation inhibitor-activating ATPase MinD
VFTPTIRKLLVEPELDQEALARNLAYDEHSGLHALLAPLRPEAGADRKLLKPAVYDKILALLVDRFDVVFLDCSVELNDPLVSQFALKRAHEVVVVVNNEQATLLDARRAIEAMIRPTDAPRVPGLGLDLDHIKIVLNQNVEGVGKDLAQIHTLLTGDDPAHPLNGVPIVSVIPDDRKLWVGHANLARPVATAGVPEIDQAFDQALGAVMDGAARYDSATRPDNAYASFDAAPRRDDADLKSAGLFGRFRRRKD